MTVEEWDRRELCNEGACNGVIGPTGTCKTCGRAAQNWGDERKRGLRNPTDAPPLAGEDEPPVLGGWASRTLCSDGTCLGVIDESGRCSVCGKPGIAVASAEEAADEDELDDEDDDELDDDDEDGDEDGDVDGDEYDDDDDDDDEEDDEEDELEDAAAALASSASPEDVATLGDPAPERELCPDGACVGVIGADGHCKLCGKARASA